MAILLTYMLMMLLFSSAALLLAVLVPQSEIGRDRAVVGAGRSAGI